MATNYPELDLEQFGGPAPALDLSQFEPQQPVERGPVGEIGTQAYAGLISDLPGSAGRALQYVTAASSRIARLAAVRLG